MQINSLSKLLKDFTVPAKRTDSMPGQKATARAEKTKVVSRPTVTPINKQAALIIRPNRCWASQPIPDKPTSIDPKSLEQARAELKIERNDHARTRDDLGNCRAEIRQLRQAISAMGEKIERLESACHDKDEIIRQLEDIKL